MTTYGIKTETNAFGSGDDYLLYIPDMDGEVLPSVLQVSKNALVYVEGNFYTVWHKIQPGVIIYGGEIVNNRTGERRHIADMIRNSIPADDPRWQTAPPNHKQFVAFQGVSK